MLCPIFVYVFYLFIDEKVSLNFTYDLLKHRCERYDIPVYYDHATLMQYIDILDNATVMELLEQVLQ